ncbi:hypothetical protein QR680_018427 [Steinernema hermaphroditum]|uniref:Uncharacterized protein n=1 Tax=Steinernema hermaphroditum TaxID=289476 RepID=A0AA39HJ69_9BILA|nr:hypothetical protein QR680_018427 [Steinernema hermaphroditum]
MSSMGSGRAESEITSSCSEARLPHESKRIAESIEGLMQQLIDNARDDEDIVLEVEIEASAPKNPIITEGKKDGKKAADPKEYFVWGHFNQTPKVPRVYQFRSLIPSKHPKSSSEATSDVSKSKKKDAVQKVESMTSTEYPSVSSLTSTHSKSKSSETITSFENGGSNAKFRRGSLSSESSRASLPPTSQLFPKANVSKPDEISKTEDKH